MSTPTAEQREMLLVENVEFKILAVANKEEKLHQLLQRFLAPVILKAASDHASVRQRVIQILARLKTFIQPPEVILPVKALFQQYKSTESGVIKQLDISFILHSLERIDEDDRRDLIPIALRGCAVDQGSPRAGTLIQIILRLLLDIRIPPRGSQEDDDFKDSIGLSDSADSNYLASMIGIFLQLRTPTPVMDWTQANKGISQADLSLFLVDNFSSVKIFQRLSELKAKLVALLASAAFTDEEKFLPALFAASSYDNRVASAAEEIIKRTSVSLEDESLVRQLFQAHSRKPAVYRTRILSTLSKSSISTTMSDHIMAVVGLDCTPQDAYGIDQGLQPLSSLERTKLHNALFQYLSWVARIGPSKVGFTIAEPLISNMQVFLSKQGWPKPEQTSADSIVLRCKAYETIGMLAQTVKHTSISGRCDLSRWLFQALSEDPTPEAVIYIDGALSGLAANTSDGQSDPQLMELLIQYMSGAEGARSVRHAAVKWANQCFPFSDVHARWIDILAIGGRQGERTDVIEQGNKGLDPWTYFAHSEVNPTLPEWERMNQVFLFEPIIGSAEGTTSSVTRSVSKDGKSPNPHGYKGLHDFRNFKGRLSALPAALRYIKHTMFLSALRADFKIEPDWMQTLDTNVKTDVKTRQIIRAYLCKATDKNMLWYISACLEGACLQDSPIIEECIRCFVDVASLCPGRVFSLSLGREVCQVFQLFEKHLVGFIKSNNKEIRSLAAKAMGILAPHPANNTDNVLTWQKTLQVQFQNAEKVVGQELNAAEGALLAFGHLCSRSVYYGRNIPMEVQFPLEFLTGENTATSLLEAALDGVSQLWSAGLAIPSLEGDQSLEKVVEMLAAQAKKGNEKAIFALGRLAVSSSLDNTTEGANDVDVLSQGILGAILKHLFALHEVKRVEVQFTVGDAITAVIARWESDFVKLTLDMDISVGKIQHGPRKVLITVVLNKLFADCKATKPSLLKASGIWLFCIVRYCSHLDEVQSRLREAQAAFMRLLSARDELVQETASRGLSLVYERGDADLKSTLVKDLVSAFTGTSTQLKVDGETELFEPGALPTGEGSSITSYKDIVNLANEVGDQRLVYKFMSLASNAATWSTRSAFGRFGLSNILSNSEIDPKLYPKLYRYRFDPNTNVQRSMDDIWKALVKDSGSVLDKYFDNILADLLVSILGKEWRSRQASCAAISDLLQGRPFPRYENQYRDVWTKALKVLDDVKSSVRDAALRLCMNLSKSLVRQLEENNNGSAANTMMQEALPFLLSDKGIESSVKDVQIFSTVTVMDIAKRGGNALKPFIPDMVPQLLGLLSTIEPEQINYHYQRAGEDSRDQIDKLRSRLVNQSPISEAIENCLRFIDEDVMVTLAPRLESTVKTAIGMPTKIGCSRVLTTLFTRHTADIKPLSAQFLKLMEKQAMDKNDEVSQAYARAAAYMMRAVPDASKQRWCERLVKMYLESEEDSRRQKVSDVMVSLAKISPDHFTAHETDLLPFSYLGSHDTDEYTCKVFKEVWSQHAGSSRTVVRYVPEIVRLVERCLDTTQWALRHTGAFTVGAMVSDVASASDATGDISEANLKALWPVFEKTLALKTFPGKEKLLESYPQFVKKGASLWKGDEKIAALMKKIVIREAKRNNNEYRFHAFTSLWKFAEARDDLDMLQEIADIVTPYLDELKDEDKADKMDIDSREDFKSKTADAGFEAIARGYNRLKLEKDPRSVFKSVLTILQPYLSSPKFNWIKREVWYGSVIELTKPLESKTFSHTQKDELSLALLHTLDIDQAEAGTESVRIKRAKAISAVITARVSGAFGVGGPDLVEFENDVEKALAGERALKVKEELKGALKKVQEVKSGVRGVKRGNEDGDWGL